MDITRMLLGALALYAAGYAVRKLLFLRNENLLDFFEAVSLDIGMGIGVSALLFFYLAFFKVELNLRTMSFALIPFLSIALYFIAKCIAGNIKKVLFKKPLRDDAVPIGERFTVAQALLIFTIILAVFILLFNSLFLPFFEWAARTVFDFKAKILFTEKTIYSAALMEPDYVHEHMDYPLLIPLAENWLYNSFGHYNDRLVKILFFGIGLAMILSLYSVLRKFTSRTYALIFTVFFSCTEVFIYRTYTGEADAPLAFFYFVAGAYLFLWMIKRKAPYFLVSAVFIAFAIFTKNEGGAFFAILAFLLFLFLCFDKKEALAGKCLKFILYITIPILLILPWMLFKAKLPVTYADIGILEFNPVNIVVKFSQNYARTREIAAYFMDQILARREWQVFWVLFITAQVFFIKVTLKRPLAYLALNVWLTILVYYINFIIIFIEPAHTLVAMGRFCLQVAPLAALLMALQIHKSGMFIASEAAQKA